MFIRNKHKLRAKEIMAAGGPQTFEEYSFLFPDSCQKCGSRRFVTMHYEASWQGDIGAGGLFTDSGSFKKCARCGDGYSSGSGESYSEWAGDEYMVESPFLISDESKRVPEWSG